VVGLAQGHPDRLDLKIAAAALREMREGFEVFAPTATSARSRCSAPLARCQPTRSTPRLATSHRCWRLWLVDRHGGWPGIMAAGLEGAGPEHAFGINIRLPFEQEANQFISSDPKLVSMKYFFTASCCS